VLAVRSKRAQQQPVAEAQGRQLEQQQEGEAEELPLAEAGSAEEEEQQAEELEQKHI
jgi:hypothetical protein